MARKKQRTSWKLSIAFAELQKIIPLMLSGMDEVADMAGYRLQKSSAIFQRSNGTLTARLVYREDREGPLQRSMVFVVRNIPDGGYSKVANG